MNSQSDKSDSVFDRLQGLYQVDPEEFERISKALIRETLENVPEEYKAQAYGVQLRIEQQLKRYKDPIARMNAMVEIFWQQFSEFQDVLNDPRQVMEKKRRCGTPAKVIELKERVSHH